MNNSTTSQLRKASAHPPDPAIVEVIGFKPLTRNTLRGWLDLALPSIGLKIAGMTLHERDDERWLSLPSRENESNGARRFAPILEFISKDARNALQRAAVNASDDFRRGVDL